MADNKKVLGYEGVGDITHLMHNQGVSDLSWLAVDEEDYRASEALPKQNLDIIPEFQKALQMEGDDKVPSLIPLRPHTIVNTNPLDRSYGNAASAYNLVPTRVAKYIMSGISDRLIVEKLQQEFSSGDLRAASTEVQSILGERGLLGNVYVDARYLTRCTQSGSPDQRLASSVAKKAPFVLATAKCTGCVHNCNGMCSSLKKRIVSHIPYNSQLASVLAPRLAAEGKQIDSVVDGNWKEGIRTAFLKNPARVCETSPQTIQTQHQVVKPNITASDVQDFVQRQYADSGIDPMPSAAYLKYAKQIMDGKLTDSTILAASLDSEIRSLSSDIGILGHTYLDMDALGGCDATLKHLSGVVDGVYPDFIIRRSATCSRCKGTSDGACSKICQVSPIVTRKPGIQPTHLARAFSRAIVRGAISLEQSGIIKNRIASDAKWHSQLPRIVATVNLMQPSESAESVYSGYQVTAFHGDPGRSLKSEPMDAEEVRRSISHLMNIGLHGKKLQEAVLNRYSREDLVQVPEVGARLASNDGIQGSYFIDPTAYVDYGKGCSSGAKLFRKQGAQRVLASDACTGCVLQTAPNWCAKYSKVLVKEVPQEIRQAAQRQLPVIKPVTVENPVDKYELDSELAFEPKKLAHTKFDIELSSQTVDH